MRWQAKVDADRRAAIKFVQRFSTELVLPRLALLADKIGHGAVAAVENFGTCSVQTDCEPIAKEEALCREFLVFVHAEISAHNDVNLVVKAEWQDQQGRCEKVVAQRRQHLRSCRDPRRHLSKASSSESQISDSRSLERAGGYRTKMLLTVHDEIVFDLHRDEQDAVLPLVEERMRTALPMKTPIVVELGVGENWLEAH